MSDFKHDLRRYIDGIEEPVSVQETMSRGNRERRFRIPVAVLAGAAVVLLPALVLFGLRMLPADEPNVADSTVPPSTVTTTIVVDTTTTSIDPAIATTEAPDPDDPTDNDTPILINDLNPTHRVVNVAADDTLNVRRGPGADEQLYAKLAPTYSGVRTTGEIGFAADGGEWWEVELIDPVRLFEIGEPLHGAPIRGWVNSAYLEPYDPTFSALPTCAGSGQVDSLGPVVNSENADHIFQIREYEFADGCLRVVITFGTQFDDSGIAPRYDMIGTDMRPVGNVPQFEIQRIQDTTVIKLEGIEHAWTTQSSNVLSEVGNDEAVDAFSVRRDDGSIDVYMPVTGWPQGVTANPATGQLIIDITKKGPETRLNTQGGVHLIGDPVFTAGGTLEFMGLARPFEASVGIQISQGGAVVLDDSVMTTDWVEAWGLFHYRAVGLDPEQEATVTISDAGEFAPTGPTFQVRADLDTERPVAEQLIDPSDLDTADALIGFAQGRIPFGDLTFVDQVKLGLNTVQEATVPGADLASPATWVIPLEHYDGIEGPFDVLGPLRRESGITLVNIGPRTHCAGPPLEFGPEWDQGRHLVIEPTGIDSCLQWYAVHLLVNDAGQIQAVTLDLWGP
ncbi:MAG: hypothetical protein GY720_22045 [bacterium]|nr:hypothetical protein [bacterium]